MAETQIKDSLKKVLNKELTEKREEERLERVKENSHLKKITLFTDKNSKLCDTYKKNLTDEGIKFKEIEISENKKEFDMIRTLTNMGAVPVVIVNKNILVMKRDFMNVKQLIMAIKHYANPEFKNPDFEGRILEQTKTHAYNIHTRLTNLEQRLMPVIGFITDLKKQLAEEEKAENAKKNK